MTLIKYSNLFHEWANRTKNSIKYNEGFTTFEMLYIKECLYKAKKYNELDIFFKNLYEASVIAKKNIPFEILNLISNKSRFLFKNKTTKFISFDLYIILDISKGIVDSKYLPLIVYCLRNQNYFTSESLMIDDYLIDELGLLEVFPEKQNKEYFEKVSIEFAEYAAKKADERLICEMLSKDSAEQIQQEYLKKKIQNEENVYSTIYDFIRKK